MHKLTKHHLIWRNAKINWFDLHWTNHIDNILKIKDSRHRALHSLFWASNHPIQQYRELYNLTSKVLVDDIKQEVDKILRILEELWEDVYRKELIY